MLSVCRDRVVDASAARVWSVFTDWPRHGRWVPFTTVEVLTASATGVGARFVGRTGLGPVGFDDPMRVTLWQPPDGDRPGRCEVVKEGRVVRGRAVLEVHRLDDAHSRAVWTYDDLVVAPVAVTRWIEPLLAPLTRAGLDRVLAGLAADVGTEAGPGFQGDR